MSFNVTVTIRDAYNPSKQCVLQYNDQQEYRKVDSYCKNKNIAEPWKALIFPIRTNSFSNFAKDFFLPNVVDTAKKTINIVAKIFLVLISLAFDLVTFPIRLLTCIPRIIVNAKAPEHPLKAYLKTPECTAALVNPNAGVKDILNSELVIVEDKAPGYRGKCRVGFIEIPMGSEDGSEALEIN